MNWNNLPESEESSLVAQIVKNLPTMWETGVWSLGQEDTLEEGMATYSSTLSWRVPWTEEPGGLQSMESKRVRHDLVTNTITFLSLKHFPAQLWTQISPRGQAQLIPYMTKWETEVQGASLIFHFVIGEVSWKPSRNYLASRVYFTIGKIGWNVGWTEIFVVVIYTTSGMKNKFTSCFLPQT